MQMWGGWFTADQAKYWDKQCDGDNEEDDEDDEEEQHHEGVVHDDSMCSWW